MIPDIIAHRLFNQQLLEPQFRNAADLVKWMGALQAQDYGMCKWAAGVRVPGNTERSVEKEIDEGKIIRTHVLRPTWHLVHADDIRWMLELTAANINRRAGTMNRQLELDEKIFKKSNKLIGGLLKNKNHLTRDEIMAGLQKKGIVTNDLRAAHLMMRAELDIIVCNGPRRGKQFTYSSFDERVPAGKKFIKEEALANLALKYFNSHGPATLPDFTWWSGLSITDSKDAIESVKSKLLSEKINNIVYWFHDKHIPSNISGTVHLLPAYDEWMIAYAERSHSLAVKYGPKTILSNGIFKAVILLDGKVAGLWKKVIKNQKMDIEIEFLGSKNNIKKKILKDKAQEIGEFFETDAQLVIL